MGVSNDAVLVYGIDLGEEQPEFLGDGDWYDFAEGKELDVDLVMYCSCDYPMYILAAKETEITAYRGHVKEIFPQNMLYDKSKDEAIRVFCEQYGIEYSQPKWLLNTLNG